MQPYGWLGNSLLSKIRPHCFKKSDYSSIPTEQQKDFSPERILRTWPKALPTSLPYAAEEQQ